MKQRLEECYQELKTATLQVLWLDSICKASRRKHDNKIQNEWNSYPITRTSRPRAQEFVWKTPYSWTSKSLCWISSPPFPPFPPSPSSLCPSFPSLPPLPLPPTSPLFPSLSHLFPHAGVCWSRELGTHWHRWYIFQCLNKLLTCTTSKQTVKIWNRQGEKANEQLHEKPRNAKLGVVTRDHISKTSKKIILNSE